MATIQLTTSTPVDPDGDTSLLGMQRYLDFGLVGGWQGLYDPHQRLVELLAPGGERFDLAFPETTTQEEAIFVIEDLCRRVDTRKAA